MISLSSLFFPLILSGTLVDVLDGILCYFAPINNFLEEEYQFPDVPVPSLMYVYRFQNNKMHLFCYLKCYFIMFFLAAYYVKDRLQMFRFHEN